MGGLFITSRTFTGWPVLCLFLALCGPFAVCQIVPLGIAGLMSKSDRPHTRPAELEDWLNHRVYHPLSYRLAAALKQTPITPNAVSVMGGAMVVAAAAVYFYGGSFWASMLGLTLHLGWHILDGTDGDLARLTGRTSPLGELIDGLCDYVGHIVLYLVLAAVLAAQIGPIGWPLMVAAGLARAVQTVFFETQRRQYQRWVYGTPWLRVSNGQGTSGALGWLAGLYLRLSTALSAGSEKLDGVIDRLPAAKRDSMRILIRAQMAPLMRFNFALSSNYRTLVIGAAMIAGLPIVIVLFELIALSVVLWLALRRARFALDSVLNQAVKMER